MDHNSPEAREEARKEQMRRYNSHINTARACRERAMKASTEAERRRLMEAHDEALGRAYHEVA